MKNLPKYVVEDRLQEFFSQKGEITDVKLMRTKYSLLFLENSNNNKISLSLHLYDIISLSLHLYNIIYT